MTFGISTHLFHNERLTEAHLAAVKRHGFDCVEFFATRSHVDYTSDKDTQAVASWMANTGVRAHSIHAPITNALKNGEMSEVWSTAAADSARRQRAVSEASLAMTFAAAIGATFVVTHLGVPDAMPAPGPDNDAGALSRSLGTLAAEARARGLTLALEVIPNCLSTPDALVARLEAASEATDDDEIIGHGVCLDVGHAHLMGGAVDAVETLGGHLVTTHIHDNAGRSDDHLVPFQGTINWSALVMAMEKVGYDGVWMFEIGAPTPGAGYDDMLAKAAAARARLEQLGEPIEF
ncbi:MAG TPA: sugar phosphate isomerase/epimerase family protein [Vicinamibacterales bacterium]|nr:sugar phosphate isomerase/epimerase family protein [Vicinamibacterales bacterium]